VGSGGRRAAKDRLGGLLGPASELLTVAPGYEIPVAAALGAAADAVAVTTTATAAEALRLLRKSDAGRAAILLTDAPEPDLPPATAPGSVGGERPAPGRRGGEHPALGRGGGERPDAPASDRAHPAPVPVPAPVPGDGDERPGPSGGWVAYAAELVRGPVELMPAVRRLLRDTVVVGTLADAEDVVHARPRLTAVTAEGDVLAAHFAQGGSAGAPSLLEVQASVDEAAAELTELGVRCAELDG
ncbi:chromosome segregation protein SMC, partial [Streptomyces sp. NPDC055078]